MLTVRCHQAFATSHRTTGHEPERISVNCAAFVSQQITTERNMCTLENGPHRASVQFRLKASAEHDGGIASGSTDSGRVPQLHRGPASRSQQSAFSARSVLIRP
jgi:hypothetical protein